MSDFFPGIAWLIPFFPLLGAGVAVLGPRRMRNRCAHSGGRGHRAGVPGLAGAACSRPTLDRTTFVMSWLTISDLEVPIEFRIDGLTTMMLSMVTFVSSLVAVFAAGYMAGDPGYPRFFALIGLFVFSMTGLVLSNNYVLTYVFWEGVGVCSYLLVGFWHTRPSAAAAAMKAFLVNRVGDFGFAIAIFWLWSIVPNHDLSYGNVFNEATLGSAAPRDGRGDRALAVLGGDRQECADPALRLAARRDGRPDAGLGLDPRRDDGDGRRLLDRAVDAAIALAPGVLHLIAVTGCATALLVGGDRRDADRLEAGAGLFDGQPARLHVHGARGRAWATSRSSRSWRRCFTCSPTPSSRHSCSSPPAA